MYHTRDKMEKIWNLYERLDLKRWFLLIFPIIIFVIFVFFSKEISVMYFEIFKNSDVKESSMKKEISQYKDILNLHIPEKKVIFDPDLLNLLYLIPQKNIKIKNNIINKSDKKKLSPPNYKISLIYIRNGRRYAIVNGKILTEGSKISDREIILRIEEDGILLDGYWGKRWIKF